MVFHPYAATLNPLLSVLSMFLKASSDPAQQPFWLLKPLVSGPHTLNNEPECEAQQTPSERNPTELCTLSGKLCVNLNAKIQTLTLYPI